jgi:proteic killer suppression protein
MIKSFADRSTERLFRLGDCSAQWQSFAKVALRKLDMLDAAESLADLRIPSGNRLKALKGQRKLQWSIRINQQWRLCFRWGESGPEDVEIIDYH